MKYSLSIVSHNNGLLLPTLFSDLSLNIKEDYEIILTLNVPEDEIFLKSVSHLPIKILRNDCPRGFGENHNRAFNVSSGNVFVIINPDIRIYRSPFLELSKCLGFGFGACVPVVNAPNGKIEDSIRKFPTIARFLIRIVFNKTEPDYLLVDKSPILIDWAAGMFIMFDRKAFADVGGFDTRYYMYLEDADICRRLWLAGWRVCVIPSASVVHFAQRASHRNYRHLKWHLRSAIRFLFNL